MLLDSSRAARWALGIAMATMAIAWPIHGHVAYAATSGGGDDDDDGDDDGSASKGDDSSDAETDTDCDGDDCPAANEKDQPPVTAGGLFTIKSYPSRQSLRPLTMTEGISEFRAGIGFDVGSATAFKTVGAQFGFRYGIRDNVEFHANFNGTDNLNTFQASVGFETALNYDVVDFRADLVFNHYPSASSTMGTNASATATDVGISVGFPFRYAPKPEIELIALDSLVTVNFDRSPDLSPAISAILNPVDQLAIILRAQAVFTNFNVNSAVAVPVSATVQYSPNNVFDLGAQFQFPNLNPQPDPTTMVAPNFYDNRFLLFYLQFRI